VMRAFLKSARVTEAKSNRNEQAIAHQTSGLIIIGAL
jgi:hypothetical protein